MPFSSLVFISIFLPSVLALYRLCRSMAAKNCLLLIASLIFYAYGEPVYVLLMVASSFINYIWALLIYRASRAKKILAALSVVENLGVLCVFKYAGFLAGLVNVVPGIAIPVPDVALPIGISFYTFQALSYVIDVYRGEMPAEKDFSRVLLYISFFPQLIAGPVVKYHDVAAELADRRQTADGIARGIRRFIAGLGKKVLIANRMGAVADTLFGAYADGINMPAAWIGAAAYMLQIYFDFSGYSDMAIGLGWMFGFHFKENFRYPYTAFSITEFWRRWHISLSGWFREYLYIPLGGNRKGKARTAINKIIVFACTGIWHGADMTFLFWGLFHGFFLMLEEYIPFFRKKGRAVRWIGHAYALLVVMIGFVFFRADDMAQGIFWVGRMFAGFHSGDAAMRLCMSVLTPLNIAVFLVGVVLSMPVKEAFSSPAFSKISWPLSLMVLILCIICLAGGTYNPFIYFRF